MTLSIMILGLSTATFVIALVVVRIALQVRTVTLQQRGDYARHRIREAVEFAAAQGRPPDKMHEYVRAQIPKAERDFLLNQLGEDGYHDYIRQSYAAVSQLIS
ncbi:MAG: hypothetical protein MJE77_45360 [Proteobacteria bacterium]|nr:hypothetical protein [Pseudomonadota bacterium]